MRDEARLIEQYRETGDLRLLGTLYEPYMPLLYGVCYRYFKDEVRSEDAVMEIFESLVVKLKQHEVHNFKAWLYALTRNHCLMELRKASPHDTVSMDGEYPEQFAEEAAKWDGEGNFDPVREGQLTLMESCLEQLSEEQGTCIRLFYLEQYCYQDIVNKTGYEMKKVKSYIQNGKRNLKLCMERNAHE